MHLSWAVRRLTPAQAKYIRLFYGAETLHEIEERVRGTDRRRRTGAASSVRE